MRTVLQPDYSTVTERPGQPASAGQFSMLAARYEWAAGYAAGKDVLEVACGAGLGLQILAAVARSVWAGDVDPANLEAARAAGAGHANVTILRLQAVGLPFQPESFDVVLLFEAIYYLPDASEFLKEALRVLRPGGRLLISSVNCEWTGFNPSPFHTRYFGADQLHRALKECGYSAQLQVGFPDQASWLRRAGVALHVIPKTMRGKALLKRIFYGRLAPLPQRLEPGTIPPEPLVPLEAGVDRTRYRVLYAASHKSSS